MQAKYKTGTEEGEKMFSQIVDRIKEDGKGRFMIA